MSEHDDQIFLKRFSMVLLVLAIVAIGLLFFAISLNNQLAPSDNPNRYLAKEDRVEPVFAVFAGETGRAAAAAAAEQVMAAATPEVAFEGSLDGGMIYDQVCAVCHTSGAAGAPRLVASDWTERMDQGVDTWFHMPSTALAPCRPREVAWTSAMSRSAPRWNICWRRFNNFFLISSFESINTVHSNNCTYPR